MVIIRCQHPTLLPLHPTIGVLHELLMTEKILATNLRKGPPPPLTLNKQIINRDCWEVSEDTLFFFIIFGLSRK